MSDFWPFREVLISDGKFAGTEGWIAGPDTRRSLNLPDPGVDEYWVIVKFRGGETAIKLRPGQMEPIERPR
ncbi:MAG TPA: hypothetical protein VMP01_26975 [Pirellulaceae bacterium]|nr:hypothetical protein [Pirellulaceae bacterium]